ncbi:MAG: hypothetical protein FJX72_05015 [Armatimonadetes bacterium]|nr:hypothetical protein [Armatimonadota bacterium]
MLRASELAAVRAAMLDLMPDTVEVQRYDQQSDDWETVETTVGRVIPKRAVVKDYDQLRGVTLWNVLLPHDADVIANDRLVTGERTYTVTDTDAGRSDPVALVAQCGRMGG